MAGTASAAAGVLELLGHAQKLKTTKRAGWVLRGLKATESIADHMYRMGLMTLVCRPEGVNMARCTELALVHDLAEALVGDITPHDGVSKAEKEALEDRAMRRLCSTLPAERGQHILSVFAEYEAGSTAEAQLVKDFDKVEMILQAEEYEQAQGVPLQEFFDSTRGRLQTETGKLWASEVLRARGQRLAAAAPGAGEAV